MSCKPTMYNKNFLSDVLSIAKLAKLLKVKKLNIR